MIDPASGACCLTNFISLAKVIPGRVYPSCRIVAYITIPVLPKQEVPLDPSPEYKANINILTGTVGSHYNTGSNSNNYPATMRSKLYYQASMPPQSTY